MPYTYIYINWEGPFGKNKKKKVIVRKEKYFSPTWMISTNLDNKFRKWTWIWKLVVNKCGRRDVYRFDKRFARSHDRQPVSQPTEWPCPETICHFYQKPISILIWRPISHFVWKSRNLYSNVSVWVYIVSPLAAPHTLVSIFLIFSILLHYVYDDRLLFGFLHIYYINVICTYILYIILGCDKANSK